MSEIYLVFSRQINISSLMRHGFINFSKVVKSRFKLKKSFNYIENLFSLSATSLPVSFKILNYSTISVYRLT